MATEEQRFTWADFGGGQRFQFEGELAGWTAAKELLNVPIVILDAFTYTEPKKGKYEEHLAARFVYQVIGGGPEVFGSSVDWQVPAQKIEKAIQAGAFPGRFPAELTVRTKPDGSIYYDIVDPVDDLPVELPF